MPHRLAAALLLVLAPVLGRGASTPVYQRGDDAGRRRGEEPVFGKVRWAPGACTRPADPRSAANVAGWLFARLAPSECRQVLDAAEATAASEICPAIVALGTKPDIVAGCWPLLLPLAPYIEDALPPYGE